MTREEFNNQLPKPTDSPIAIKPPFLFNGMSGRIFPLRANLDALQQLCDGYLNFIPEEVGRFRVSLPYVYLMVLDYGQVAEPAAMAGWFAQLEVFFSINVEWYKLVSGQWIFHDWAVITPYIFVDDDFSVPLGRTVYGFPKVLAKVTSATSKWISDPVAPVSLLRVATTVFPEAYSGKDIEIKTFLDIQRSTMSNLQVPFDPTSPAMPWTIASNVADAIAGFSRDAMWLAQAMRIFPVNPAAYPGVIPEMLRRMAPAFAPGGQGFVQNSLNLKQFRRSESPAHICYQALTNGQMQTTAFNGGGLLGEENILLGDLSGGHTIRLYEHSSLPISRTLGLEVHRHWHGRDAEVSEIKPVLPFWFNVNIAYHEGENLAWRTHDGIWRDAVGAPFDPTEQPAKDSPYFNTTVPSAIEAISGPFQFSGMTIRVLPLLAHKATLQTYLDNYVNCLLESRIAWGDGAEEHVRFQVWARPPAQINPGKPVGGDFAYVYLTASSYGSVTSESNNVGNWAQYELSFMIPVTWERQIACSWPRSEANADAEWCVMGVGLVPAFSYADNCIAAISRLEIQGIETNTANFVRPESAWLADQGELSADPEQTLLRMDAEVWSAVGEGQKADIQPAIEIVRGDPGAGLSDDPDAPWRWAELLRLEQGTKSGTKIGFPNELRIARTLALELLGNATPVSIYTVKQFRDVADPDKACYQSIVRVPRAFTEIFDVREIEETLVVRIHDYPSLPIVEALGIVAPRAEDSTTGIVHTAQAIRPFYVRATMVEQLGQRMLSRAGGMDWKIYDPAFETLMSDAEGAPVIAPDAIAEMLQDQMDPCRTAAVVYEARQRRRFMNDSDRTEAEKLLSDRGVGPKLEISAEDARAAVARVDAQMIIESVLSREWSNYDPNARWRRGRNELIKAFAALPQGGDMKPFAEAEMFRRINNLLAAPPGAVAGVIPANETAPAGSALKPWPFSIGEGPPDPADGAALRWGKEMYEIIETSRQFTEWGLKLEQSVDLLACVVILGLANAQSVYEKLNVAVPSLDDLVEAGKRLMTALAAIQQLKIAGEPSERNNLDTSVQADNFRLGELLGTLHTELLSELAKDSSPAVILEVARQHGEELRQVVDLARRCCQAQREALLNKMSRAYQKPDFCIRRDALRTHRDQLLPLTFSWNEDWYYGRKIELL